MNPDPELLGLLNSDPKILIARNEYRVADGSIARECDHIGDNKRVHAFLFANAVNEAESYLDVLQVSERKMLRRRAGRCPVVPINSEEWHSGNPCAKIAESLYGLFMPEDNLRSRSFRPARSIEP